MFPRVKTLLEYTTPCHQGIMQFFPLFLAQSANTTHGHFDQHPNVLLPAVLVRRELLTSCSNLLQATLQLRYDDLQVLATLHYFSRMENRLDPAMGIQQS